MRYRAITSENFYFTELKNTCLYLLEHNEIKNLKVSLQEHDILDCTSESNFNKKFLSIQKRLKAFTPNLMELFVKVDYNSAKFINLYSIVHQERLIAEFMDEVIREKYILFDYFLTEGDFLKFMQHKQQQSDVIASWSEAGRKKMIVKLKNFLVETGFLEKIIEDGNYKIIKPLVDPLVIETIKEQGNEKILSIMLY